MVMTVMDTIGGIDSLDPTLATLIDLHAQIEVIGRGFDWTEGPAWDRRRNCLYFSDIPKNTIHKWTPDEGISDFLKPGGADHGMGCAGAMPGTNGLFYSDRDDAIYICNQNARSVDRIDLATGERRLIASDWTGKRFNSPNDVIQTRSGLLIFTDPPFGLLDQSESRSREIDFTGLFAIDAHGETILLSLDVSMPNGLVTSPDGRYLYVSQSDQNQQVIRRFEQTTFAYEMAGSTWVDLGEFSDAGDPGLPDGMTTDTHGNVFATCAGGVAIINPDGKILGRIRTGRATANCTFGLDGSVLFITAHDLLLKIRTKTRGIGFAHE